MDRVNSWDSGSTPESHEGGSAQSTNSSDQDSIASGEIIQWPGRRGVNNATRDQGHSHLRVGLNLSWRKTTVHNSTNWRETASPIGGSVSDDGTFPLQQD